MKAIEWIKEHKKDILVTGITAVVGGLGLYYISKKMPKCKNIGSATESLTDTFKSEILNVIDIGVGALDDAVKYNNGTVELWLDNLRIDELGDLGEAITNNVPDLPENANVWALLCIREDRP